MCRDGVQLLLAEPVGRSCHCHGSVPRSVHVFCYTLGRRGLLVGRAGDMRGRFGHQPAGRSDFLRAGIALLQHADAFRFLNGIAHDCNGRYLLTDM